MQGRVLAALLFALAALVRGVALYIEHQTNAVVTAVGLVAAAGPARRTRRRSYRRPPLPKARDWWDRVVPYMREHDRRRFKRCFRVSVKVADEIVAAAEMHPLFMVSSHNLSRAVSVSKKIHMTLWRLGRPATVGDCADLFGLSDGFVDYWTAICLQFIKDQFGDRIWKRKSYECVPIYILWKYIGVF